MRVEARNAIRLRGLLPENPGVVIPEIHSKWTRERLCVMERLEGVSLAEWLRAGVEPAEGRRIARLGAETVLHSVLVDGCFHADPHPGNLLRLADGGSGLVDFGMIGNLSEGYTSPL